MGQMIVKVSRSRDLYMVWSSIVDNAVWLGTKAELIEELVAEEAKRVRTEIERSFERADERGTSARVFGQEGAWDDRTGLLVQNLDGLPPWGGRLPRENFEAYAEALMADDDERAAALVNSEKPGDWDG